MHNRVDKAIQKHPHWQPSPEDLALEEAFDAIEILNRFMLHRDRPLASELWAILRKLDERRKPAMCEHRERKMGLGRRP